VADCLELWKLNNLFKIFLLSFILSFLASVFLLHNILVSRYLVIPLIVGIAIYAAFAAIPLVRKTRNVLPGNTTSDRPIFPKTSVIGVIAIALLFGTAFFMVRNYTSPALGYQLVGSQFLVLPNGTTFTMHPVTPTNKCAWLESMNIATQQKARDLGLPDCDYAWPHVNLSQPTLFLEFENYTEFAYVIKTSVNPTPSSTGIALPCFTIPTQSFQCWVPPARISNLR